MLPATLALLLLARPLDLLSLGEKEARALSLPVHGLRLVVFGLCALVAGPVTAVAGAVPFVGLVAPHALRALLGPLGRRRLPAVELPLGSVMAFVGAPYFLLALRGQEGRG